VGMSTLKHFIVVETTRGYVHVKTS